MADDNKYTITIATKDTSDPEKAEGIKQRIESPQESLKDIGALHKDILAFGNKSGTSQDKEFIGQAFNKFMTVLNTATRSVSGVGQNIEKEQKETSEESGAKEIKKAASNLEEVTTELKEVIKETRREGNKEKKPKTKPGQKSAPPWEGEEQPPLPESDLIFSSGRNKKKTYQPGLPARRATGEKKSFIESSDALMSQIKSDFAKFKEKFASSMRTRLQAEHDEGFKVVEGKGGAYTRRGGTEVLKIANMPELINALIKLTNSTEKTAALADEGPAAMIGHASDVVAEQMIGKLGTKPKAQDAKAIKQIVSNINKYGYEGSNKAIQKLVKSQEVKEKNIPIGERKGINVSQFKETIEADAAIKGTKPNIRPVFAETVAKEEINRTIGKSIQEIVIPRPVAGPQGFPAMQMKSGGHRTLSPEYEFSPGILEAGEFARKLIGVGGKNLPDKAITERIQGATTNRYINKEGKSVSKVPNIRQMMVAGDVGGMASHASDIMEVLKTDKKGRLELINAYRTVLSAKGQKVSDTIPTGKKEQLEYLSKLGADAKRLSLGFDDVLVAMGKLTKSSIFERLFGSLTTESTGKTSPLRTTMRNIGKGEDAVNQFNKRIAEVFVQQEAIDPGKPRAAYYQSKVSKLISPRLTVGGPEDYVGSADRKASLIALNKETEQFLALHKGTAGYTETLTSQGIGESRAPGVKPDPRDPSKIITNAYTTDIRAEMPLGEQSNWSRSIAPVYQTGEGGTTFGGEITGGLEMPKLQSQRGRDLEQSGMWGKGYGLNLQTVMADSAGTFEDQIEIAGKAVNRFSEYVKPRIKDVKDVESADVISQDIVKSFAPAIGEQLRMKEPGKAGDDRLLVSEISKILTSKTGASLDQRAVTIIERIFTSLGTKMTTHAGSKGTVTFKKGEEGELGYTKRQAFTHEIMSDMLEKRKKADPEKSKTIDTMLKNLKEVGTAPFVDFMHRDLEKKVQDRFKRIKTAVLKMLEIDTSLTNEGLINEVKRKAKDEGFGEETLTKRIPNEVRMTLTGAVKRLNVGEPLEAIYNNIAGEVNAIAPKTADLSSGGEVAKVLEAMGYSYGPEKDATKRTLPMYSKMEGMGELTHAISGKKFWQYTREPSQEKEWEKGDIWSGRKGQKMNIAAMGAITSMFGEKSPVTSEAVATYMPETNRAIETIMSLKTLGEEPTKDIPKSAYISTKGLKELPGVIEKYEDLRDTILDPKFSAGGYAEVPEFNEKGKETGSRALYVPSREAITTYEAKGEGLGANTLATRFGSLLANIEKYKQIKGQTYLETDKADVDILRRNVGAELGKSISSFRKNIGDIFKDKKERGMDKGDTKALLKFLNKLYSVLDKMSGTEIAERAPGIKKGNIKSRIEGIEEQVTKEGVLPKKGGGLGRAQKLLIDLKDTVIEPKVDLENIERAQKDIGIMERGGSIADLSEKSYLYYKKMSRFKPNIGEGGFERESPDARGYVLSGLRNYVDRLSYGKTSVGAFSASEAAVREGAEQFGITTDPKKQALEESRKNIENDKRRLGEELIKTTAGKEKGYDILQTRRIPAIRGQFHAAVNDKVDDFTEAIKIIDSLGQSGVLKDTGITQSVEKQLATHSKAIEKERKAGGVVLKEGEIGMHAARIEKLTGDYGKGRTALDAVREGDDITSMSTRFPYTGFASMQFGKIRESTHPEGRHVISMAGASPALEEKAFTNKEKTGILDQLGTARDRLRKERTELPEEKRGTQAAKDVEAKREKLTIHINKLSNAIDLLTVKFHGFAQNMDTDGDNVNIHTARTKSAAKEIEKTAKSYSTGKFGQTLDPRSFINKMMSYNVAGDVSSMADLAGLYEARADVPGAKIFQTPDITKEMKGMSMPDVVAALAKEGVTPEKLDKIVRAKGLEGPEATEETARGILYDKVRRKQLEKIYVKSGIGENTESINKIARFFEASVGFGEKQITNKEYGGWKEGSVALGAVYDKGGKLSQKALPAREMQTMMNVMLEQVINAGMRGAKHGTGELMYKDLTRGLASGELFGKMQQDDRFKDIIKANEIIKQTIRDRLDALNDVDFAAEAKRHKFKGVKGRKAQTEELVKRFSFEGFTENMSKDIQEQAFGVMTKRHKRKGLSDSAARAAAINERRVKLDAGTFDISSYFSEMQPSYTLRSSTSSVDSLAKQSKKGKTKLDKAMHRVLSIVRSSGRGVSLSDTLIRSSFKQFFEMLNKADTLGQNLEKIFKKGKTLRQQEKQTAGLGRKLGVPKTSAKETEMLMAEAREKHLKEFPDAKEDTTQIAERKAVLAARQEAIRKHVAVTKHKRGLLGRAVPEIESMYQAYAAGVAETKTPTPPAKRPPMPPQGERTMFGGVPAIGVVREEWAMNEEKVVAALQKKEQERKKIAARKEKISKGEYVYPQSFDIKEDFNEPYSFRDDISSALKSREIKSRALIHAQTLKRTGFESQRRGELWMPVDPAGAKIEQIQKGKKAIPEVPKIPRGKTSDVDYSVFGIGSVKDFVKVLEKYRKAIKMLSEGAENLTEAQTKKANEALRFIEQHKTSLSSIPSGARGHKAATDILNLSDKIKGVKKQPTTSVASLPPGTSQYGSDLEALIAMTTKAERATGFSPEGLPDEVSDILTGIRTKRVTSKEGSTGLKTLMDTGAIPEGRRRSVWKQYHVEKVQAEVLEAQKAEKEGDYASKKRAEMDAKRAIVGTFSSSLTPFLTRAGGTGRVTGHIDEGARTKLGIRRVGVEKKEIYDTMSTESGTAAAAMKPLLFGTGRMEERLKATWAILRRFSPELAEAGKYSKAFNFDSAVEDIAIIREGLMKLRTSGRQMSPGEFTELEHALSMTKKMEKAVVGRDERILPTLALDELETKKTAEVAFENLQTKISEDMMAEAGVSVAPGIKRKVSMKIPTGRGTAEKREVTLMAEGDQAFGTAGKVTGIKRVDQKTTVEKQHMPSERAVKLFEQFGKSTDRMDKKIKDLYLGVKRFSSATGEVNFDEALSDLQDLYILIQRGIKTPGLGEKEGLELRHLGKKVAFAHKTISETPEGAMSGVIMKDMETQASAEAALKSQIALKKELMMGSEDLEVGMSTTVAATIPTEKGPEKRKVKLVATGEEGVVSGIKEEKYKPKKEFVDDLLKGKTSRASSLFKSFIEGSGDANKRISDMLLGVKRFDMSLIKAGKHAQAINFDTAELDLVEMIALFDKLLKGATQLTDKEREMYTMAKTAAKEMHRKVVKTPVGARGGITMGGYETPESSIAAHQARIAAKNRELIKKGELGARATVTSKIMTASGQEETRKTRLTTRGDKWFGFGGRASKVTERDESPQGQTGSVLRRVAMWGSASGIVYGIIGGVRSMLETMKVAETGMVNLQKVMPKVGTDFDKMRDSAIGFAKTYGAELKGVLETMRIFAQQGLPQPQVLELTRVSTLAANVTTMDPTKSAEALTSATRQFNIEGEDAIKILDSWNEVENKFAITAADLADGFKKAGTAARITGIDVHKLNGIITAIGEATRQTGKEVGTSLKFIFSRMATEKAPRALSAVGVETMEGGRLREGSDILDDLAKRWAGLTRSQKLATAQAIGGIRHYNALMVLMSNYHRALSATEASISSVGSAEKENKMVMATYAKQLAKTKASFDSLAVSTGSSLLPVLKTFTKTLRGLVDVVNMLPQGGLGTLIMGSYAAATGLGKYFDLSMFGLLGERGVGGEKRKRRTPFGMGRVAEEKYAPLGERAMKAGAISSLVYGTEGAERRKLTKQLAPAKITPSVRALDKLKKVATGIGPAFVTARNTSLGFLASLGPFVKIAIVLAAAGAAIWGIGKAMSSTFASASERTKEYVENLEVVEATLDKIGSAKSLAVKMDITTERVGVLNELTPKQVAAQVQGRSYKSPLLLMKTQQQQVQDYANSVASMTTEGVYGFDRFGNAIISTTDALGKVISSLEEIASKAMIDLKLNIIGEQLEDLLSGPEIEGAWDTFLLRVRQIIRGGGKLVGQDLMKGYMNTFEKTNEVVDKIGEMREQAASEGRTITPPTMALKEKDPELYKERDKEYKKFTKLNIERMSSLKEFKEKFSESKRDFMTIRRPGLSPESASKVAFGETGEKLAAIEEDMSPFYKKRGIGQEEIQAGYFHKLMGSMAIRPTAMLTRETAMEQGIAPREATAAILEAIRPGDIMLAEKGAKFKGKEGEEFGISTGQIQVLKSLEDGGQDMVAYVKEAATESGKITTAVVQSKDKFFEMAGGIQTVAENIKEVIDSAGMLSETAMKLRAISIMPTGAEAGMFKPTKGKKLDLGKQYKFQIDTGMLIQNNAFGNLSKNTESFVNSYVKKQEELKKSQKIALDVYGKRNVIDDADAAAAKALALSLAGVTNTAIQLTRATTEMDKSFERLALRAKEQAAVKEVGRQVRLKRTGLLAGMPDVKAPQIDIRKFSELSGHEKLRATSPTYEKTFLNYDTQMDKYNTAVTKAETSAKTLADIKYIEEEAGLQGKNKEEIASLLDSVAMTGSKETGPMLSEMSTQTSLQQQMVDKLTSLEAFSAGGKETGLAHAGVEKKSSDLYNAQPVRYSFISGTSTTPKIDIEGMQQRKQTTRSVKENIAAYASGDNLAGIGVYSERLKDTLISKPGDKGFSEERKDRDIERVNNLMTDSILGAFQPEKLKGLLLKADVTEPEYEKAKEKKNISGLVFDNIDSLMRSFKESIKPEEGKSIKAETGSIIDPIGDLREKAKDVIKERKAAVKTSHESNLEDAKIQGSVAKVFAQKLSKAQKSMRMFNAVAGDLIRAIDSISESFLKLEKQSAINKALIDTRAEYRSTRGGPMGRRAPAVDIDTSTTAAQYQPHQLLYNQSAQYRNVTTDYLKNMEDVKTARSKIEELSKIKAQKSFLEKQPGVKKEDVDSFVSAAMRTGSVEIAPIVVELARLNETASSIDSKTVEQGASEPDGKEKQVAAISLEAMEQKAKAENRSTESRAMRGSEYLRQRQIEKQTDIDVAAGRGKSQDQVNREESEEIAKLGYVRPEIKERNQRLRAEYEKEKKARAEFELNKQNLLKPLQQAASGMGSMISSIQTGVAGIEGGRNIRPLERDFEKWSKNRSEEDVADAQTQFNLAKSLYSQNLSLRAQGSDTGVAPRKLYDIMERASKGEDVTDELKAIESTLAKKKEEKEAQIRKIQAQEYAKAVSNSEGTKKTNTELSDVNSNARTIIGTLNENFSKLISATEATSKVVENTAKVDTETAQKAAQATGSTGEAASKTVGRSEALSKTEAAQKAPQAAEGGMVEVYKAPPGVEATAETKASHVYTGAYGGEITQTPVEEHKWGVPVGQDSAYAFVEKAQVEKGGMAAEKLLGLGGASAEKETITAGKAEDKSLIEASMFTGEKLKPYSGIERGDYLLASDEKKSRMADALSSKEKAEPFIKKPDFGYSTSLKEAGKTEEEIKKEEMIRSAAKGGLTVGLPEKGETTNDGTITPEVEKRISDMLIEKKAAGLKEESKETKSLKEKSLKETGQDKKSRKESEGLNTEISDLNDEVEKLRTTITDINDVFKGLSDSVDSINALGDASKGSASLVDQFGESVSTAASSLDDFSSKASTATTESNESGPTMEAEDVDFDFISEEDAINLVNSTKEELLENINDIDNTELLDSLVEKTDTIGEDVASIKEDNTRLFDDLTEKTNTISEDVVSIKEDVADIPDKEDFNTFKEKALKYFEEIDKVKNINLDKFVNLTDFDGLKNVVDGYVQTIDELKKLTERLAETSLSQFASILELEKAFDLVSNELKDHDENLAKLEEDLGSMDHKFTTAISDLRSDVAEAIDLARSAWSLASQKNT